MLGALLATAGSARADVAADEAACGKKQPKACLDAGVAYINGTGVAKDLAKALAYYQKACTWKHATGCGFAGSMLTSGDGTAKDPAAGFALRTKACKGKHGPSCNDLGTAWSEGKDGAASVDHIKAKALYEQACKLADGLGCFNLGNVFRLGEGMKHPYPKQAVTFFQRSCDLEQAKGCTELAIILYEGKAAPKDADRAVRLLERGCTLGSEVACKNHKLLTQKSP